MNFSRRMVLVDWKDAYGEVQWRDIGSYPGVSLCQNIGFLVQTRKDCIVLSGGHDNELERVHHIMVIPKGCVTKITRLVVSKRG